MPAKAAAKKSAATPVVTPVMPGKNGGTLRRGGPNGGAGGRPPDEFKRAVAALADEAVRRGYVLKILQDHDHPQFMRALEWAADRGYGKVAQGVALQNPDGSPLIPLGAIRELLAEDEDG